MSHQYITHKSKEILFIDYSGCETKEEVFKILEESTGIIAQHAGGALVLVNFEGLSGSREIMQKVKEMSGKVDHKVAKRAVLGVTGLKKILLQGFNRVAKTKAVPFDTKDQALDFLIK